MALANAQNTNASPEQVREVITQQAPEFQKLADSVPKTSSALVGYLKIVLAALTLVLGYLTYMESRKKSVTPEELDRKIQEAINRALSPPSKQAGTPSKKVRARAKKARHR